MSTRPACPTTVITGSLGVGKTTAILDVFRHRPEGERWAVLVNEFGQVGIDGPVLESGGLQVKEVAGGCICCTAGLELRVALVRLIREVRPDRLIIEPSGVARPATVIDVLRSPGLKDAVTVNAVITLVDPRAFIDPERRQREAFSDQVLLADVLVGNRADQCTADELAQFTAEAQGLFPPKVAVAVTEGGVLDPAWLDLRPAPTVRQRRVGRGHQHEHHEHHEHHDHAPGPRHGSSQSPQASEGSGAGATTPGRYPAHGDDADSCGWIWPPEATFDRWDLEEALQALVHPCDALPMGSLRIKGVFRTPRVALLVHAQPDAVRFEALNWRRDSRVEVLAPAGSDPRWDDVEALLEGCRRDEGPS